MHYVYTDEAGRNDEDPVTVVVALLADEAKRTAAQRLVLELTKQVPVLARDSFVAHATEIFQDGNGRLREHWSLEQRIEFLNAVANIPVYLGIPICLAMVRRNACPPDPRGVFPRSVYHHAWAFALCMAHADRYLRTHAGPDERAKLIAEEIPEMHRHLEGIFQQIRNTPFAVPNNIREVTVQGRAGRSMNRDVELRIERIEGPISFASAGSDPLLLVVDTLAFSLKRYLSGLGRGEQLIVPFPTEVSEMRAYSYGTRLLYQLNAD